MQEIYKFVRTSTARAFAAVSRGSAAAVRRLDAGIADFSLTGTVDRRERTIAKLGELRVTRALEPDAAMIEHARAANARLLSVFPEGFALDATHHPHVTMIQQFVNTADLDKVYAAANKILASEKPTAWKLKAFKYYYIPDGEFGLGGIVVELRKCATAAA